MRKTILILKFMRMERHGETLIGKYNASIPFMRSMIPLVDVHENGLIEFTEGEYGLLIRADPPRVGEEALTKHTRKIQTAIDSLHGDLTFKTIACSRSDLSKPLAARLTQLAAEPDKTQAQKEHIYKIYEEIENNATPVIQWAFFIFVGIGKHNTAYDAQRTRGAIFPGLLKNLRRSDLQVNVVEGKADVAIAYRQMITQRVISWA